VSQVNEKDLKAEIEDIRERFPKLKADDIFVAWFMKCYITDTELDGIASLVGGSGDKSLDAVYIDDTARKVFVVQGKYHQKVSRSTERRSDILAFADIARSFADDEAFSAYCKDLAVDTAGKAEAARKRIKRHDYRLQLYFVTTGKCSAALIKEAKNNVRRNNAYADIGIIEGKAVLRLLSEYIHGVARPVPLLELEIESGNGVTLSGVLQRFDKQTKIESWVVPVAGDQIARIYDSAGARIFARNIRGYLGGNTNINRSLKETLDTEPDYFWYYNNGITIVCDLAEQISKGGSKWLKIINPQIINGQQTTRTLHEYSTKSGKATVLVRVISVHQETDYDEQRFESLISKIVAATNWQNEIRASDLMANDRRQIELERNFRKIDYQYVRKRQSKGEAKRNAGVKHRFIITKVELAQVVAACDLDPLVVREGREKLFEKNYYSSIFPSSDVDYFLPRYWLSKHVSQQARTFPERGYAKWVVLHFMWQHLSPVLGPKALKRAFRIESESGLVPGLSRAVNAAYKGASAYYRANRGSGAKQIDPSSFFKHADHHIEFEKFWERRDNKHRSEFSRAWSTFEERMVELLNE
jgi:hypothetical protein